MPAVDEIRPRQVCRWLIAAFPPLVVIVLLQPSVALAQAKREFVRHPELIEGPWEFSTPSGTYGLFIRIETWWRDAVPTAPCPGGGCTCSHEVFERELANPRTITQQSVDISAFRPGRDTQYLGTSSSLNGRHLTLDSLWGSLDADFHSETGEWTGSWGHPETMRRVVLRRPRTPPGKRPNPFAGNWLGLPGANTPADPSTLHVVESSDRTITAWLERKGGGLDCRTFSLKIDQKNGELLRVLSAKDGSISFETTNAMGPLFRYEGRLSPDGKEILGAWSSFGGEHFNAPAAFRKTLPAK